MIGDLPMTDNSSPEILRVQKAPKMKKTQPDLFREDKEVALSRRKLPKYRQNPFIDDQLLNQLAGKKNVYYTQMTQSSLLDMQTGEIDPAKIQIVKQVRSDKEQFVKIYTTHLKAFFELSTTAYKVLHYILYEIQNNAINHDQVLLSLLKAQHFFTEQGSKISSATFYRAMKELVEKLFLAETEQGSVYFINPKLFFNGDRVEFITKFMIEEKHTIEKYNNDIKKLKE